MARRSSSRSSFPVVPVAVGAVALGGLYYLLRRSKAEAQVEAVKAAADPRMKAALGVAGVAHDAFGYVPSMKG